MSVEQVYAPHCRRLGNAFDLLDKTSESNVLNLCDNSAEQLCECWWCPVEVGHGDNLQKFHGKCNQLAWGLEKKNDRMSKQDSWLAAVFWEPAICSIAIDISKWATKITIKCAVTALLCLLLRSLNGCHHICIIALKWYWCTQHLGTPDCATEDDRH